MKYSRLTKEQFEALHEEFAQFLATQSIDQPQWEEMKREQPSLVEEELDLFSDLIWEKTLKKTAYLENTAASQVLLFGIGTETMQGLLFAMIMNEKGELLHLPEYMTYASALLLAGIHFYNLKYCQCKNDNIKDTLND